MSNLSEPRKFDIWDNHQFESWDEERQWIKGYLKEEIRCHFPDFTGIIWFSICWILISIYLVFKNTKLFSLLRS